MSVESFRDLSGSQMVPAGPDYFGGWYEALPAEKRFSYSTVPQDRQADYAAWKARTGFSETADYDLAGAFLAGMEPTMVRHDDGREYPHLGSFGIDGKLLKAPTHETFWKSALDMMIYQQQGQAGVDAIPWDRLQTRDQGLAFVQELLGLPGRHDRAGLAPTVEPPGGGYLPPPPLQGQPFPFFTDAEALREAGFGYNLSGQSFLRGDVVRRSDEPLLRRSYEGESVDAVIDRAAAAKASKPKSWEEGAQMMTTAAAANRSAIAGLGFDPHHIVIAAGEEDKKSGVLGVYRSSQDLIVAQAKSASTPTHESIHRGIQRLLDSEALPADLRKWLDRDVKVGGIEESVDELVTRQIMRETMGAIEMNQRLVFAADEFFSEPTNRANLQRLEDIAAQEIARRTPRGPR